MVWVEVFAVFLVSHGVGDFVLQTNWQATNKHGGLGRDARARRALLAHIATYLLAFVPALIWLASELGMVAIAVAAAIAIPHAVQDDARLLARYAMAVKRIDVKASPVVAVLLDQAFHVVALFVVAVALGN